MGRAESQKHTITRTNTRDGSKLWRGLNPRFAARQTLITVVLLERRMAGLTSETEVRQDTQEKASETVHSTARQQ